MELSWSDNMKLLMKEAEKDNCFFKFVREDKHKEDNFCIAGGKKYIDKKRNEPIGFKWHDDTIWLLYILEKKDFEDFKNSNAKEIEDFEEYLYPDCDIRFFCYFTDKMKKEMSQKLIDKCKKKAEERMSEQLKRDLLIKNVISVAYGK